MIRRKQGRKINQYYYWYKNEWYTMDRLQTHKNVKVSPGTFCNRVYKYFSGQQTMFDTIEKCMLPRNEVDYLSPNRPEILDTAEKKEFLAVLSLFKVGSLSHTVE